ncbi:peroxiredoxin-like family protein [Pelagicoccus sp. SDUM812005]|uniref:peroxiredoxin-like family protein n=1 Tax=Pelagicoccus sp. SDUM812005 TaxID=3041257 RepID=UPI00280DF02A|nr:peroxiredoxin-like family protein [Pelagicoccus sp. SDUM812005]MDQ8183466.1 peroxiredoxin-like family protein [Pelagicoccus sp. SDUM812005]
MTSLRQQTEAQIEKTRQAKPEFMQAIDDIMATARSFAEGKEALETGQKAPDFSLPDAAGNTVSLSQLLKEGPVVLNFYRGSWCPYCNLELKALQERLPEIKKLGATLVAISPEVPDESLSPEAIANLTFPVLSDQDAQVAAKYGIAWQVPELILEHMRADRNLDLKQINNGNGSVLPIPATFVLDGQGIVRWRHVDVDYRKRAEPDDILAALAALAD